MTPAAVPRVILNTVASGGDEDTGLRCCLSLTAPGTAIGAPSLWDFVRHCPIRAAEIVLYNRMGS